MNINLDETFNMLNDLKKDEIDLSSLPVNYKDVVSCLEELEEITDYASMLDNMSHQYLINAKKLLTTARNRRLLDVAEYKEFSNRLLTFHEEDLQLYELILSFSAAFLSLVEAECQNLREEQLCVPFYKLNCEIHAIKKAIKKTLENFESWYKKLFAKIEMGIEKNSTTLSQTLNRFFKNFNKRLTLDIDETLYYKIMSSLVE